MSDKSMSPEALESFGFRPYDPKFPFDRWDKSWSYCVRGAVGKRLFVHVRFWDNRKYGESFDGWDAWVQFKTKVGDHVIDMNLHDASAMTPAQVVEWFCQAWEALGCRYYERWDGND